MANLKHNNQVRIIGGVCRGRKLAFAPAEGLRPTPDSVREKLFNWLRQDLTGLTVLDLFGGSGALGLEAASRNAAKVIMVDNQHRTGKFLLENIKTLKLTQVEVVVSDGLSYLLNTNETFDVVFLDPPFQWQEWEKLFGILKKNLKNNAMVYVEAGRLPSKPAWLEPYREGKAGMSKFELLHYTQTSES